MAANSILMQLHKKIKSKENRDSIVKAFKECDLNGDGRLSVDEIFKIFQDHEVPVTIEEIREVVLAADKDGTGQLTIQEFANSTLAMETVQEGRGEGKGDTKSELKREDAKQVDGTKSPLPSRKEGGGGGGGPGNPGEKHDKAEMAFKLFDKDKDGFITKSEMVKLSKTLTKDQIDKAFKKFDSDGDGRLSYSEFKKMMHK